MTYGEIEALIEATAAKVLRGAGHFHCGDGTSLTQAVRRNGYPVIHLDPVRGARSFQHNTADAAISMGFLEKGGPDMTSAQRQAIYSRQEAISRRFLVEMEENDAIGHVQPADALVHNYTAEMLTGIAVEFTLRVPLDPCS